MEVNQTLDNALKLEPMYTLNCIYKEIKKHKPQAKQTDIKKKEEYYRYAIIIGTYKYDISAVYETGMKSYLGCIANTRDGGNDLTDGRFNQKIREQIIEDILDYEKHKRR